MQKQGSIILTVWLDDSNKVISIKEIPNARQLYFENREMGLQALNFLVTKGYKIG